MKFRNWSTAMVCKVLSAAAAIIGWVALNSAAWADHGGEDGDDEAIARRIAGLWCSELDPLCRFAPMVI